MPNPLLDRYIAGEQRQVWQDLLELGAAVRTDFYYSAAKAVADETMRRARHNVEAIIAKLTKLGYRFGMQIDPPPLGDPFKPGALEKSAQAMMQFPHLRGLMGNLGKDPAQIAKDTLERMKQFGDPKFEPRNQSEETMQKMSRQIAEMREQIAQRGIDIETQLAKLPKPKQPPAFEPPPKSASRQLNSYERKAGGPLPISVRSWYELVGGVNLEGSHETIAPPGLGDSREALNVMSFSDVQKVTEMFIGGDEEEDQRTDAASELILWGQDGDQYSIKAPDTAADAAIVGWNVTFVAHLRRAFAWGGFPGWERVEERPQKEIDSLKEGLLPL